MRYTVKRVSNANLLGNDWSAGQWKLANVLQLKNYMGHMPTYFPKTQVKLLYDDENLYVFFRVEDQYVRAVTDKIHGRVWEDSCVEFFFTPGSELEDTYFNIETNCIGTMLFKYNHNKNTSREYIELSDCKKVKIYHSISKIIKEEIIEPIIWTLNYKLPFNVIAKYCEMTSPKTSVTWKANFYKCAEKTSNPHWLTWSFVDNPKPDFHLPKYFGVLEFE